MKRKNERKENKSGKIDDIPETFHAWHDDMFYVISQTEQTKSRHKSKKNAKRQRNN